ncbi:MAG: PTS sugar transporter subunit IIB [Erysipelotrichaceae bacterium]|nr:PTS sugar transporter subunit IIB [Erysipelotrichaceae bacterium]MBQ5805052.1 PTS sugar transporter subunit IIB [Erysipelotrichaceae bacterium]MBQ6125627.1 PTS sugar transporter subunit IIB [Erysipelotrichaceae bacterium]
MINMIRVDDRLIHGQIVAAWVKSLGLERIWIVDDATANDSFLKNVMKMVAPPNVEFSVSAEDNIAETAKQYDQDKVKTLVLVKYPATAEKIFNTGISFRELQIGGIGANADRKKVYKNISMSDDEMRSCRNMINVGVNVYIQVTPDDKQISLDQF